MGQIVAEDMKSEMKREVSQVRVNFKEDVKAQMDELTTSINQQVDANGVRRCLRCR